jgi:hypothetical protein
MLHLRVFGSSAAIEAVADDLGRVRGAGHMTLTGTGDGSGRTVLTADLEPATADEVLRRLDRLGVQAGDFSLLRLDAIQAGPQLGESLVWTDLLGQAAAHARPVARYLVFMAAAGVIAAYGVIYDKASGALLVLGINVMALVTGGALTLAVQRRLTRRATASSSAATPAT